jgi:alpha-L-rhamnosidase
VRVWHKINNPSEWSTIQNFTTGLFSQKDWISAKWIGYEKIDQGMKIVPGVHAPDADTLGNKCM